MEKRQKDMKRKIQETALRLFTKRGYDKASLREIAEELGITKAALYYHFQSKEDILRSITTEIFASLEELMTWAESEPASADLRKEFLKRFADLAFDRLKQFIPFAIANISSLQSLSQSLHRGRKRTKSPSPMERIRAILCEPGADVEAQFRSILALVVVFAGASPLGGMNQIETQADQIKRIALAAAIELLPQSMSSIKELH